MLVFDFMISCFSIPNVHGLNLINEKGFKGMSQRTKYMNSENLC